MPARAALFLDFDGTLAPIAPRPQDVRVPEWVLPVLGELTASLQGAVAIVSGRPISEIDAMLHPMVLPVAGIHGAELRRPDGRIEQHYAAPPPGVDASARALVLAHPGLMLEVKAAGLVMHYRARPDLELVCKQVLHAALAEAGTEAAATWEWLDGHAGIELKQRRVSKGRALEVFLSMLPFRGRVPVYVGDDVTDEDGINAAQAAGGSGVRVGPGATVAHHRLADPAAVGRWLAQAVAVQQGVDS